MLASSAANESGPHLRGPEFKVCVASPGKPNKGHTTKFTKDTKSGLSMDICASREALPFLLGVLGVLGGQKGLRSTNSRSIGPLAAKQPLRTRELPLNPPFTSHG
jgi:hypothetical protein